MSSRLQLNFLKHALEDYFDKFYYVFNDPDFNFKASTEFLQRFMH